MGKVRIVRQEVLGTSHIQIVIRNNNQMSVALEFESLCHFSGTGSSAPKTIRLVFQSRDHLTESLHIHVNVAIQVSAPTSRLGEK